MRKFHLTRKHWFAVGALCAVAAIFAAAALLNPRRGTDTAVYNNLSEDVVSDAPLVSKPIPAPPAPEPEPEPEDDGVRPADKDIDFEALFERNPDIIAWVSVPGADIEYPVLKSADNMDYLEHDVDKNENFAGAIFMDMANSTDFSDRLSVLYGHNLINGEMFAALHNFEDKEFFDGNREFKLYTAEGMRTYEIIAAYETSDAHLLYQTNYSNDTVWEYYVDSIFANRDLSANLLERTVDGEDRIMTLSTCVRGVTNRRYLVQGVLKKDDV